MKPTFLSLIAVVMLIMAGCSDNFVQPEAEEPMVEISADSIKGYYQLDSLYRATPDFSTLYWSKVSDSVFLRNPAFSWGSGIYSADSILFTEYGFVGPGSVTKVMAPAKQLTYIWPPANCSCPVSSELMLRGGQTSQGYCFFLKYVGEPLQLATDRVVTRHYPYTPSGPVGGIFKNMDGVRKCGRGFIVCLTSGYWAQDLTGYIYIDAKTGDCKGYYRDLAYMQTNYTYGHLKD